jgi:YbgC/YbaW family acyl-CoA thioester hydrolase
VTEKKPFVWKSRVRFGDTDASGRIYYASMFRHFDSAETEFLRSLNCGYGEQRTGPVAFPRVRAECDYLSAVGYDDLMQITVRVDRIGRSSYTLAFAASVDDRAVARGKVTAVCMNRKTQKAAPLPPEWIKALKSAG